MVGAMTPNERYSRGAIAFHWIIALLVAINLTIGLGGDAMPRAWGVMPIHKAIGITVLVLTLARIAWRVAHPAPPLPADLAGWERGVAHASHFLLYFFMLAMPLTGWAMSSGPDPRPLMWFGLFDIPYLPVSEATSKAGHDVHGPLGLGFLALILVHAAAALRHHFLLRDNVLARMLPVVTPPVPLEDNPAIP